VIEPGVGHQSIEAIASTRLGVFGPVDDTSDSTVNDRTCAHRARLERDIESITLESPRSQSAARQSEGQSLRMRGWIVQSLAKIEGLGKDSPSPRHNRAHRNFADRHGLASECQRPPHHIPIPRRLVLQGQFGFARGHVSSVPENSKPRDDLVPTEPPERRVTKPSDSLRNLNLGSILSRPISFARGVGLATASRWQG
jgi:hypothetical protein